MYYFQEVGLQNISRDVQIHYDFSVVFLVQYFNTVHSERLELTFI
jgi:hypothetical protein